MLTRKKDRSFKEVFVSWFGKQIGDKPFLKKVAKIAIPIYLTAVLALVVNIVDSIMISPLGAEKLAAVNAAAEINFFGVAVTFGCMIMGFVFFTQYHGKDRNGFETKSALSTTTYWVVVIAILLIIFVQFLAKDLVSLFLKSPNAIDISVEYLQIVSISWLPFVFVGVISRVLIRTGKPIISIFISIASLISNVVLNYMFINGVGVPELGVKGVALSTLVARVIELGVAVTIVLIFRIPEFQGFGNPKYVSWKMSKKIFSKWLVIMNEVFWSLSLIVQFGIMSSRGDNATAIVGSAFVIAQVLFAAHGSFSGIMSYFVGRTLGKDKLEEAKKMANKLIKTILFFAFCYSLIFFFVSFGVVQLYSPGNSSGLTAEEFRMYLQYCIWTIAGMYIFFSLELACVSALWLGGKVVQAFIGDVITNWIVNAGAYLLLTFTNMTFIELFVFIYLADLIKTSTLFYFYRRYDWVVNLTIEERKIPWKEKVKMIFQKKEKINEER